MECLWRKRGNSLVPADPVTADILATTQEGKTVTTSEPRQRRNPDHHRWMMAILAKVLENSDAFADIEDLMFHLKMRCRMYKTVTLRGGKIGIVPKSISFAAMSQQQFKRVADRWLYIIGTEILPGVDVEALLVEASREAA